MITIGVDESGTGAWAGPFHVAACAVRDDDLKGIGLNDSKALSDKKRRALVPEILRRSVVHVVEVGVDAINRGQGAAWSTAVCDAIFVVMGLVLERQHDTGYYSDSILDRGSFKVIIDGPPRAQVVDYLELAKLRAIWEPRADSKYESVMAASIVAKTRRNDAMLALHALYPDYGWDRNAGYGTEAHISAIKYIGVTTHHRKLVEKAMQKSRGLMKSGVPRWEL